MYDFAAISNEELNLKAGQKIFLAPRSLQSKSIPGWWIATDNRNVGLVPANYVTIVGQLKKKSEIENRNATESTLMPSSMQNTTSNETVMTDVKTFEPSTSQQSTNFSENDIKEDMF